MFLKYFLFYCCFITAFLLFTHTNLISAGKYPAGFFVRSNLLPNFSACGISVDSKIFGGDLTDLDEFPWMVILEYQRQGKSEFDCGGFLINERYVVTAAHCVDQNLISVRLGEWNLETNPDCSEVDNCAPPVVDIPIEEKIIYKENSSNKNSRHDIALLRLKYQVKYSDFIKPICLPTTFDEISKTYAGEKLLVAGWGKTETSNISKIKLKVQVPVKKLSDCEVAFKRAYNIDVHLDENQICAGGEKGKDSCVGDSGGPLMAQKKDKNHDSRYFAVGLVSTGPAKCGTENEPGIYVRVVKYVTWIVSNLRP